MYRFVLNGFKKVRMNTTQNGPTIIAIGGGGFTHETDPELEEFIITQSPLKHPSIQASDLSAPQAMITQIE
jgi:hypothetical protein